MAFWKKSEDPWDRKPGKPYGKSQPRETRPEAGASPLDALKKWNGKRKTAAKEKEEAMRLPPEKCPWCGKDMEQGYIAGGRDSVCWYPGVLTTKRIWLGGPRDERLAVCDEGGLASYKTTWLCRDCKKLVFNMPEPDTWSGFSDGFCGEETKEEETGGE